MRLNIGDLTAICYDWELIKIFKTSPIQTISANFPLHRPQIAIDQYMKMAHCVRCD